LEGPSKVTRNKIVTVFGTRMTLLDHSDVSQADARPC